MISNNFEGKSKTMPRQVIPAEVSHEIFWVALFTNLLSCVVVTVSTFPLHWIATRLRGRAPTELFPPDSKQDVGDTVIGLKPTNKHEGVFA